MPIYKFKCPNCGLEIEKLVNNTDNLVFCDVCVINVEGPDGYVGTFQPEMRQVLSIPSPMQWGCRKGF